MAAMREAWTDERLDDLNLRVEKGFERVDRELLALRVEMRSEFTALRSEIAAFQRMFLQLSGGMFATMVIGFAGLIATQI
jgi:hypothetical protein